MQHELCIYRIKSDFQDFQKTEPQKEVMFFAFF